MLVKKTHGNRKPVSCVLTPLVQIPRRDMLSNTVKSPAGGGLSGIVDSCPGKLTAVLSLRVDSCP